MDYTPLLLNKVIFKALCYSRLVFLKDMGINISCDCNIAMA